MSTSESPPQPWKKEYRWVLIAVYVIGLGSNLHFRGLSLAREEVFFWLVLAMTVLSVGRTDAWRPLVDWLPFGMLLVAYDHTRGIADTLAMPVQYWMPINFDEAVFRSLPTVTLQDWLGIRDGMKPQWWQVPLSVMYATHFVVPYTIAAVLWIRDRDRGRGFIKRYILLTVMGLTSYILLPMAPPWLASKKGYIDVHVVRSTGLGWRYLEFNFAERALHIGQASGNAVAAFPSLHTAFPALICAYFWNRVRPGWRLLLAAFPIGMGFTLVVDGEHYVLDVLAGIIFGVVANLLISMWESRREARLVGTDEESASAGADGPSSGAAGPAAGTENPAAGTGNPAAGTGNPATGTENPVLASPPQL